MRKFKNVTMCCLMTLGAMACGCVQTDTTLQVKPFETEELESCLAIVVDMSGSFAHEWEDRAHPLLLELMDQFFVGSQGGESRVVLCQMSGHEDVVLFEGSAGDLRAKFRTPEALVEFLADNSDPAGSPVYRATDRAIDYVSSMPGIGPETRVMTVILSDMEESGATDGPRTAAGIRMLDTLRRYQQLGGALALYFVSEREQSRWQQILEAADFSPGCYVIENDLVAKPRLPRFE